MFFRMRKFIFISLFFLTISIPVYSMDTVLDPANLIQNLLSVIQTIKEVSQTASMLSNTYSQVKYKLQSLQTLGSGSFASLAKLLDGNIDDLNSFLNNLNSIGYTFDSVSGQFDAIFPPGTSWDKIKLGDYGGIFGKWVNELTNSSRAAMQAQSVLSRVRKNHLEAIDILAQSRSAAGEVRQLQASNEMLAVIASQLGDLTQAVAASGRVAATAEAVSASEKTASRHAAEVAMDGFTDSSEHKPAYNSLPKFK